MSEFFSLLNFCSSKMFLGFWNACKFILGGGGILGCLGRPTPPPGGRAGSENDTLLPMTMTCDQLKFWSGLAWRSKVTIRKPWRWKNNKGGECLIIKCTAWGLKITIYTYVYSILTCIVHVYYLPSAATWWMLEHNNIWMRLDPGHLYVLETPANGQIAQIY